MSSYGFGKKQPVKVDDGSVVDISGLSRQPLPVDPQREEVAMRRGAALGFVDRGDEGGGQGTTPARRTRPKIPQSSLYIKGPTELLDWFVELSNERGHKAYWQTLAELRDLLGTNPRDPD